MPESSKQINLCYGAFFKVLSAFKKESVNDWQLHNRLMNIEDIPFGAAASYSVGASNTILSGKRLGEEMDNPYQTISDFSNCQKTQTLPIQRAASARRFMERFLHPEDHRRILEYILTQIIRYLDEHRRLARAIVETLSLTAESSVPMTAVFHIDIDPAIASNKNDIINNRTDFNIVLLIGGVFHYIVENCTDNRDGNRLPIDESGRPAGTTVKGWNKPALMRAGVFEGRDIGAVSNDIPALKEITASATQDEAETAVSVPQDVKRLYPFLLSHLSAGQLLIHGGITALDDMDLEALAKCGALKGITVSPDNPRLISKNGALLSRKTNSLKNKLVKVPSAFSGEYEIDDSADEIGSLCFSGCNKITRAVIPDSVAYIHGKAFSGCGELKEVVVNCVNAYIAEDAFAGCPSLTGFIISDKASSAVRRALSANSPKNSGNTSGGEC